MFCPKCGGALDDDARFCPACGSAVGQPQSEQAAPATQPAAVTTPAKPAGRWEFDLKIAPIQNKIFTFLVWGLTLAIIAVMLGGYSSILKTSVEDVPVVSVALESFDIDDDFDDLKDGLEEDIEYFRDRLSFLEDEFSRKELRLAEDLLDGLEDCADEFSINNLVNLVYTLEDADDVIDIMGAEVHAFRNIVAAMNMVKFIVLFGALFALAFTVFGGIFRIRGLVIAGLVFSILYTLPFCGAPYLIFAVLIHAAMITFISINKKAYNKYLFNT